MGNTFYMLVNISETLVGGLHEWESTSKSLVPILKIIPLM